MSSRARKAVLWWIAAELAFALLLIPFWRLVVAPLWKALHG